MRRGLEDAGHLAVVDFLMRPAIGRSDENDRGVPSVANVRAELAVDLRLLAEVKGLAIPVAGITALDAQLNRVHAHLALDVETGVDTGAILLRPEDAEINRIEDHVMQMITMRAVGGEEVAAIDRALYGRPWLSREQDVRFDGGQRVHDYTFGVVALVYGTR